MPDTKQVFQWRKEGKLDEAISLARQLFARAPSDPWVIKAYGWTLHDCLKAANGPTAAETMRGLFAEFEKMQIPEDDELLLKFRDSWRAKIPAANNEVPLSELLDRAKQASEAGNRQEALQICRKALKLYPNATQASMSLGWEIQRALKDAVSEEAIDGQVVQRLLQEYALIPHLKKPDNLHSLILARAAHAATKDRFPAFIKFFKSWDPKNLQPDDFQRFTPEGSDRSFDSRVEQVIRAIHKTADAESDKENIAWAADFVGQHYEKFPDQKWFPYYYGQLLVKTGNLHHARDLIIPIVRRKRKDFWSWHTLAGTFGPGETDKRLACLCKSLLCHAQEEKFLVNVHAELGEMLASQGNYGSAKYEIARSIEIREAQKPKPWKIPQKLRELRASGWYTQAEAPKGNKELYEHHAPSAEALIFEGLPELKAILMHQIPPSDDKPGLSFVAYLVNDKQEEARVKTKHFDCLRDTKTGSPLTLQIDDSTESPMVVSIRLRPGAAWDLLPDYIGIVRQVNMEKGVTAVVLGKDEFCLFHHDRFPDAAQLEAGNIVAVKLRRDAQHDKTIPLAFIATDREPPAEICRRYSGAFEAILDKPFGFVNAGNIRVFVPPDLVEKKAVSGGAAVHGIAILELDKVKNRYGWRAVTISKA